MSKLILKPPKEIKIKTVNQIKKKLSRDGDLREHVFWPDEKYMCCEGDDLGFYQQACEFLLSKLDKK